MLKYAGYDIVFQEIPDEVTLALNLSGCPNGCPGCHSPHLQRDEGKALTPGALERLPAAAYTNRNIGRRHDGTETI